ncbi:hypothetical protein [Modestobacter sp. Leaf380]|uniref:hypothetical protein n=1 Tax=Modestobacter sp. Leaf380 TaxID=1736356 RepID=UPI0006F3652C|nr:hypothetical protein [Modestobacter sp. Leaf380]KQS64248.1 hypothetical protein ASG41_16370 [Modestobacter sp. Leaf380]
MPDTSGPDVRTVVIACDAGLSTDRLLAAQLTRRLPRDVHVAHHAVDAIPAAASVVLVQRSHEGRLRSHLRHDVPVVAYDSGASGEDLQRLLTAIRDGSSVLG